MRAFLPNSAFLGNIENFLRGLEETSDETRFDVSFHDKWVFVHPVVLAMVAATARQISLSGGKVSAATPEATSRHYLDVIGLYDYLDIPSSGVTRHEPTGRFIRITRIKDARELSSFIKDVIPLLHAPREQTEPIEYVISELVRNVLEHSYSGEGAFVCAQYFPDKKRVSIGVADRGIGVRRSLAQSYEVAGDMDAILLALTPGVTGTRRHGISEMNAGAGLFFTRSIARSNNQFFVMISGTAVYKLKKSKSARLVLHSDPAKEHCTLLDGMPFWKGTAVGIDISTRDTPEFASFLSFVRDVYFKELKARRATATKKPRFI